MYISFTFEEENLKIIYRRFRPPAFNYTFFSMVSENHGCGGATIQQYITLVAFILEIIRNIYTYTYT